MYTNKLKLLRAPLLFDKCLKVKLIKRNLNSDEYHNHQHLLTSYFGLTKFHASNYIAKHRLGIFELQEIVKSVNFCKDNLGFDNEDIIKNPQLFRYKHIVLDNYSNYLKEAQIILTPASLAKFRTLIKRTVNNLKYNRCILANTNVASSFISHLDPCPEGFNIQAPGNVSVSSIHNLIMREYLKWRLQINEAQIEELMINHSQLKNRCFTFVCEMIKIAENLGFSKNRISRCAYIMRAHPSYTKALLENGDVAGTTLQDQMKIYPKLMTISPEKVDLMYKLLKKYQMSDEQIRRQMSVFCLAPETVAIRLDEFEHDPAFHVLRHDLWALNLVSSHVNAKSRLEYLKQIEMKCFTAKVLGNKNSFETYIKQGSDITSFKDTCNFLENLLKVSCEKFKKTLRKHPLHKYVALQDINASFKYLTERKFTIKQIAEFVYVLLYPKESLEESFYQIELLERRENKRFNAITKLNLALYLIEKEHHFNGEGIWAVKADCMDVSAL